MHVHKVLFDLSEKNLYFKNVVKQYLQRYTMIFSAFGYFMYQPHMDLRLIRQIVFKIQFNSQRYSNPKVVQQGLIRGSRCIKPRQVKCRNVRKIWQGTHLHIWTRKKFVQRLTLGLHSLRTLKWELENNSRQPMN